MSVNLMHTWSAIPLCIIRNSVVMQHEPATAPQHLMGAWCANQFSTVLTMPALRLFHHRGEVTLLGDGHENGSVPLVGCYRAIKLLEFF